MITAARIGVIDLQPMDVACIRKRYERIEYLAKQYLTHAVENGETPREFVDYAAEPDMRADVMREIRRLRRAATV